ncbi:MAG TPA: hypothetical protein VFB86_02815, partial [Bacteroidales bacterium]|nr:hypothetical protein [Bacteroidales bacterium]
MSLPRHILCLALLFFVSGPVSFSSGSLSNTGILKGENARDTTLMRLTDLNGRLFEALESGSVYGEADKLAGEIKKVLSEERITDTLLLSDSYYV